MMLPADIKEAATIERRKRAEQERKGRIFNARQRLIGIDKETLEQQVVERKLRDEAAKRAEDAFLAQQARDAEIATRWERQLEKERRKINEEIDKFRNIYQRPETRREFDLNDPDALKKAKPPRKDDDDTSCGLSSAQRFQGEDLSSEKRHKAQSEELKAWLSQQMEERQRAERARKKAEEEHAEIIKAQDKRAADLEMLEQECRRRLQEATSSFNKALAEEQSSEKQLQALKELEDKEAEIYNCLTGDFLTENPEAAVSNLGPKKIIASKYKGMTPQQRLEVRKFQLQQIQEKKLLNEAEERKEAEWRQMINGSARYVALRDMELSRKQRELTKQLVEENKRMALEQKIHQDYMDKFVFTNTPSEAYYSQFNTSTR